MTDFVIEYWYDTGRGAKYGNKIKAYEGCVKIVLKIFINILWPIAYACVYVEILTI